MKKSILLTSVLALAACGGGSGGGHGVSRPVVPTVPSDVSGVTAEARSSNDAITTIASEVVSQTSSAESVAERYSTIRSSTKTSSNGNTYLVSNLEDVDFAFADEGFDGAFLFQVGSDGRIEGILMPGDEEDEERSFVRGEGDVNTFVGMVHVGGDDDDDAEKEEGYEGGKDVEGKLTFASMGKKHNVPLKYSDFGTISIDVMDGWTPIFIGGYNDESGKKIDMAAVTGDAMTFSGVAVGSVSAVHAGEDYAWNKNTVRDTSEDAEPVAFLDLEDKGATLTFDPKSHTQQLAATFGNWYNVQYTKDVTSKEQGQVTFSENTTGNSDFYLIKDTNGAGGTITVTGEDFRYYGDNGTPSEVVGLIQTRDCRNGICTDMDDDKNPFMDEIRMNLGFGGTK